MKHKAALKLVKDKLPEKRYEHSVRVAETAVKMAGIFEADKDKCYLAGILHDYSKYDDLGTMYQYVTKYNLDPALLAFNSELLHGPVAATIMRFEYGIEDESIYFAISSHTSGRPQMLLIEKIIYVADYIEPDRKQPGVDKIRDLVFEEKNLDLAIYEITRMTLKSLLKKNRPIYNRTIECYNYYNMVKE
ncbi:bis(5'-nucleosyl)-tetraphosphatase (symmetrical) YqeK [Lacicoccus alkaliphilus]|uniref:bis(5'-nucleosyl)-tetraphosphatase (symmetrical) n=1 Tax=Lacicoccus alkaliphilus DSM 16010 TaxID=1123231 RepID=A0A1M7BNU8_9BACL|nr:bis(5'-nucleosyl)-tetraphosphatase (symmetrical) YqeK [Salinicoccus alkaliphilus]SHL56597.1 putative HD superfamily hydrolase of NAD metabolism [Salinicoccus alkaliphilus DSM 16010]